MRAMVSVRVVGCGSKVMAEYGGCHRMKKFTPTYIMHYQTRNKSIVPSRTMHTGRMSCHSTKKGVTYYVNNKQG